METIEQYFTKQCENNQKTKFNIFSALHNETDERRLHSRFIAYLLSSESNHGMGNEFLKLFLSTVLKYNFDLNNYKVETEYKILTYLSIMINRLLLLKIKFILSTNLSNWKDIIIRLIKK